MEEHLRQRNFPRNSALLQQLQQRQLDNIFHIQFAHCTDLLQTEPLKDSHYYFSAYQLAEEAKSFFDQNEEKDAQSLQAKADNLDVFYLTTKLRASCEMLLQAKKGKSRFRFNLVQEVMQFLEKQDNNFLKIPVIKIYWTIINTLTNEEEEDHYLQLQHLLQNHFKDFSKQEALEMFAYAQHYCLQKIAKGHHDYLVNLFELLQFQLENGIKFKNGHLPLEDYKSLVALGLRLGNHNWVKSFLKSYKHKLPPEVASDAFIYYTATYHHAVGDTKGLIRQLKDYRFEDIYYTINARFLLIQTYFKQEQYRHLNDEIDAFRLLLMRSKVVKTQEKQGIQNCLKILKRILRLGTNSTTSSAVERWQKIQDQIQNLQPLYNRNWLGEVLEKVQYN